MTWKRLSALVLGLGLVVAAGCDTRKDPAPKGGDKKEEEIDHSQHDPGPHGGTIFDIAGGKYHGEFKVDHAKKEATLWLFATDMKTPAPVKADKVRLVVSNTNPKIEIDLLPADKSADGKTFTFTGKHDGFTTEQKYKGTVSFKVGDTPYSGDFEEEESKKR
jgi:hypothetical protein